MCGEHRRYGAAYCLMRDRACSLWSDALLAAAAKLLVCYATYYCAVAWDWWSDVVAALASEVAVTVLVPAGPVGRSRGAAVRLWTEQ